VTLLERLARRPPAFSRIPLSELARAARDPDAAGALAERLRQRLGASSVWLARSGREALRLALAAAARDTGRPEVLIPAYTCPSVPAACVAAGLRVRLLDLDAHGQAIAAEIGDDAWSSAAACVVDNLFGIPSPIGELAARAAAHGAWLIDDAAQAIGALSPEGAIGSRGDVGVLSFGRGKPLSGLGGGALAWTAVPGSGAGPEPSAPAPLSAALRWSLYQLAASRPLFGLLASIPALGIGETVYDPAFERGGIQGAAGLLALAALSDLDASARARRARAHALAARLAQRGCEFEPLLEPPACRGVYPRLALLAPTPARRDSALERLRGLGATGMYPVSLGEIEALAPHVVGPRERPGAARFCARLLTVPTHSGVGERALERIAALLC
jgi:dTDP-4-amino-4,6-dideoxygalactose transaminase